MAYWFAGFFARPPVSRPATLPPRACWRAVSKPFDGIGVRLPELTGSEPTVEAIKTLARDLGLEGSASWVYLTYTCWAGGIDSVYGFVKSTEEFGPVGESGVGKTKTAYVELMSHFGLSAAEALDFEPFRRGFWGDE